MKKIIISLVIALGIGALLTSCGGNMNGGEAESVVKKAETMVKDVVDGAKERLEDMSEWATHDDNDFIIGRDGEHHRPIERSRLFPNGK